MKNNLIHSRTCVYNINYHIVWSVKYRRKVLTPEVEYSMRQWAVEAADIHGFTVHLFEIGNRDHVHCFVSAPPQMPISQVVKVLKGTLGRYAFREFPWLRGYLWKGKLRNPSYYVETIGSVSEENIRGYIENQVKE